MQPDPSPAQLSEPPPTRDIQEPHGGAGELDDLYRLFGADAVLIPVAAKPAANLSVACPVVTWQETQELAYQDRLRSENIAVACRDGLFAVFFATDAARADFLKVNPPLRTALITCGPPGTILWLRCLNGPPVNLSLPGSLCWLGAGEAIVVLGRGALAPAFKILNGAKPVSVGFDTIRWPEPLRIEFILHRVLQRHGPPATKDPRDRTIPNWDFWARCFSLIRHVGYDLARESFVRRPPGGELQLLPEELVLGLISAFLADLGRQPRFVLLSSYRQTRFLKEFLAILKIVTAQVQNAEDQLEKFLAATVEPCDGSDVSSAELNLAQLQYFAARKLPPYPAHQFEKRAPGYLERMFHVVSSRKVRRNGKYCRGYAHVQLKPQGAV
ncbi:MAG: hypothetical protein WCS42_01615 [Verrucomicrobiota bacterium]